MGDNLVITPLDTVPVQEGFSGQIVRCENQTAQTVFRQADDEPGIAQTLLDIANPEGELEIGSGMVNSAVDHQMHAVDGSIIDLQENEDRVIRLEDASEDQKRQASDSIRTQIAALCGQLNELGEESFLLTFRATEDSCQHVGSLKGDHFCLLRPELLKDFSSFCQGKESEMAVGQDKEEASESVFPEEPMEDDVEKEEQEEEQTAKSPEVTYGKEIRPRVIVLKRTADGKVTADHPYVGEKPPPNHGKELDVSQEEGNQSETVNQKKGPNVLFLCEICKSIFSNVIALRLHKKEKHNEMEYPCDKCSRVFTLQRNLDKHLCDAHFDENRYICDSCVLEFKSAEELAEHNDNCHDSDLPMRCDVCEQTFQDLPKLMIHRKMHFDYVCFCTNCWQGFFDYLELEIHHQHNCHYKEALFKCYICGKKFTKLSLISRHIDSHPVHSPHVCRMCGRGFETEKELRNHRVGAHIIRPFKCEMCTKTFKKKEALIEHRRIHLRVKLPGTRSASEMNTDVAGNTVPDTIDYIHMDGEPKKDFECKICGICLSSQSNLDQHLHQHETATEQFSCDNCDRVFFSHSLLSMHCRKDHKIFLSSKENPVLPDLKVCEWDGCNKTFYDRNKLRQHMKYHEQRADRIARGVPLSPKKSLTECTVCGKVLKYKSYLKAHMMTHNNEAPFQCDQCGQSYPSSKRLADHIRVHNGEKPFKCKLCDKSFTSSTLRNQHMVIHWGHKKFICDVCGKGFMSRKHFHDHLRIHNGEQQYRCEVCGKEFIYYRSLVRHSQVHIDPKVRPKPYKCEICKKEYTEVTGYKHHMRSVHTGENPYQCEICGEGFHRNDKLKRHLKTRHNMNDMKQGVIVTTRRQPHGGAPVIVKAETGAQEDLLQQGDQLLQIVQGDNLADAQSELHVDVIQEGTGQQQVFLIGLNQEGGDSAYLQETQVIEGADGTRYIIAGSGQELQVIESGNLQQLSEAGVIEGSVVQQVGDAEEGEDNILIMNDGAIVSSDQETLSTLANMASVAEIVQQ